MSFTPPEQRVRPANFPQPSASLLRPAAVVALVAVVVFSSGIRDDSFIDEYAYITQSYYSDLYFSGRLNDPEWLHGLAYDLQPLPKYLIGMGMRAANQRMPRRDDAVHWYLNAQTRFGPPTTLWAARVPFIATGVLGCLALDVLGVQIGGWITGALGGILLVMNPLYRLHAHRAMSDVPCEAFMIAALAFALAGSSRIWTGRGMTLGGLLFAAAGVFSGLSIACKFNGFLALIVVSAWCGLGLVARGLGPWRRLGLAGGAVVTVAMAIVTFLALNPALTAHPRGPLARDMAPRAGEGPWRRFQEMIKVRIDTAASQKQMAKFSGYVLDSPLDKAGVFAVQGFGRFGPLGPSGSDSEVRYETRQDWGLVLWWPLVALGIGQSWQRGRQQLRDGLPPTSLALLVWAVLAWVVVAAYLPLAWDRYLLPIQAPNALLGAVGLCAIFSRLRREAVPE